jgi:hypothetical protein
MKRYYNKQLVSTISQQHGNVNVIENTKRDMAKMILNEIEQDLEFRVDQVTSPISTTPMTMISVEVTVQTKQDKDNEETK